MTIGDGRNIGKPINQELCLVAQLSLPQQFSTAPTLPQTVPQAACPSPALFSHLSLTRPQDTSMSNAFSLAVQISSTPVAMLLWSFLTRVNELSQRYEQAFPQVFRPCLLPRRHVFTAPASHLGHLQKRADSSSSPGA